MQRQEIPTIRENRNCNIDVNNLSLRTSKEDGGGGGRWGGEEGGEVGEVGEPYMKKAD